MMFWNLIIALLFLSVFSACAEDDPSITDNTPPDGSTENGKECASDELVYEENVDTCEPAETDYMPRENGSENDTWDKCISDDDQYHRMENSISSIARVEAYDAIAKLLWNKADFSTQDFLNARILFEEEQGIGSRVARRYDPHYTAPTGEGKCEDKDVAKQYPEYCVGPAVLQPTIVTAFAQGSEGNDLVINAAKIHASLQWFLYVSAYKEGTTCMDTPKDCDSCWAYYSGGTSRENPIGLAAEVDSWAPETHDRVFDGVLAVRCWRDLDQAVPAENVDMQELAMSQLDFALLRGMGIIVRQYFQELSCTTGNYQQAALEALRILIPLLDRETRERNNITADLLKSEISKDATEINTTQILDAIDATYPCP